MTFRVLRIFPALIVEVILSALILGPFTTEFNLERYFSDHYFYSYFFNLIGFIHYELPGVFLHNHDRAINASLFTVPSEILCYVTLAGLIAFGLAKNKKWMLKFYIAYLATLFLTFFFIKGSTEIVPTNWKLFLAYFYSGAVIFVYRDKIRMSIGLFLLSIVGFALCIFQYPALLFAFGPLSIAYFICYLGMMKLPKSKILNSGDYSYGIYLYGFPIQQTFFWLMPNSTWYVNFAYSLPAISAFAAFSWWFIEKPCLSLRKRFFKNTPTESHLHLRGEPVAPDERFSKAPPEQVQI